MTHKLGAKISGGNMVATPITEVDVHLLGFCSFVETLIKHGNESTTCLVNVFYQQLCYVWSQAEFRNIRCFVFAAGERCSNFRVIEHHLKDFTYSFI